MIQMLFSLFKCYLLQNHQLKTHFLPIFTFEYQPICNTLLVLKTRSKYFIRILQTNTRALVLNERS